MVAIFQKKFISQYWHNVKNWTVWLPVLERDIEELDFNKLFRKPQNFNYERSWMLMFIKRLMNIFTRDNMFEIRNYS